MPSRTSLPPRRWDATGEILTGAAGVHPAAAATQHGSSRVLLMVDALCHTLGVARAQAIIDVGAASQAHTWPVPELGCVCSPMPVWRELWMCQQNVRRAARSNLHALMHA